MIINKLVFLYITLLVVGFSCSDKKVITDSGNNNQQPLDATIKIKVDTLATGLQNPWGMAFLPDNRVLITEKGGSIKVFANGKIESQNVQGLPAIAASGQGGLLDITLHPDYATNGWIYFTYSKPGPGGSTTTVARAKLQGSSLAELRDLFSVHPYISSGVHFGSRIVFDGKGYMFISTGERGTKTNSQDMTTHNGKIMRLHDDGRVPSDNPFVNTANAKPEIWSLGHRNVQGMIYDAGNGLLWAHEHGPRGGDEINLVQKGKNYGWPVVTHGIDYDGSVISNEKEKAGIEPPVHTWTPSIAPCGMTLVTSDKYKPWKGNLLVGALAGQHLARVKISDNKSAGEEKLLNGIGRIRAVSQAPDGFVYVLTESPGMFLRLTPVQ